MNIEKLLNDHGLTGTGRIVGTVTREYTAVATATLASDLNANDIPFEYFIADNREHPDFGKRCIAFTIFHV